MEQGAPKKIVIVAFEGSVEMSITITRDVFCAANRVQVRREGLNRRDLDKLVVVATQDGHPVSTFSGSRFVPDAAIADVGDPDLVVVSGIWSKFSELASRYRQTLEWLRAQYLRGIPIASLHSGTYLLAEAGLLEGKLATVYWQMEQEFQARYPGIILKPERRITQADNLFCSAGIGSGLEMSVYLIERLYGVSTAQRVSQSFLMDVPRETAGFQLAFDRQKAHGDRQVLAAQQWLELNFSSDFLMDEVADKVGLSHRSFMRRFKKATGDTPLNYLQRVRLEAARELLASSSLSIDQISYRVGYEDASFFNRLFKKAFDETPGAYRKSL
jgi:transcriptional regulator GlxA family with amidase domain